MATKQQVNDFIELIAPMVQKLVKQYGLPFASPIIAQACLESGYGTTELAVNAYNFHGLKYKKSVSGDKYYVKIAKEQNPDGSYYSYECKWCAASDTYSGIEMYFKFVCGNSRYSNLYGASSPEEYIELIRADGYATSLTYVEKVTKVLNQYDLKKYDEDQETETFYTVKRGDTLWGIAKKFYGDGRKYPIIAEANNIENPDIIHTGQKLLIPEV